MASHWSFGHLHSKLWAKEGSGIKLAVWLPTTKSRESTCSRRGLREFDMALEISLWGLQVWFRPLPDRRSGRRATKSQSPGSPNRDKFWDSTLGVPGKRAIRMPLPWANVKNTIGSWWWHLPSPGRGVSCKFELACGLSQHQMHTKWLLTNSCWFWMQVRDQIAWSLPSLISELPTRPLYPF
jgi:hypothetical protein